MVNESAATGESPRLASFRDPAGRLLAVEDRIFRVVRRDALADLQAFLASKTYKKFQARGALVQTTFLDEAASRDLFAKPEITRLLGDGEDCVVVEHERVAFASFPYEWSPQMLYNAAELTLDFMASLVTEGLGLKDATPYNVLFRGAQPVFVDLLSFERRAADDSLWAACAQFERLFLLPLLVNKHFGVALDQLLMTRRDGLEPEEVYKLCGFWQRLSPAFLTKVSIPTWLGRRHQAKGAKGEDDAGIYQRQALANPDKARFILESLLGRLRRALERARPRRAARSTWSDYLDANNNYTQAHFQAKETFVEQAMREMQPARLLDVGCNTGHFSRLAARGGASVVAIDYDPVVVGETWKQARQEKLDILPLAVNLTRPTPATGWRNQECAAFLERARGRFDAVLMLAVIHHMLVTERVPLAEILELAAELTRDALIVEFIAPDDSMFRRLTRGRERLHQDLTAESFEAVCRRHFTIARVQHLENTSRWLYLLRKK